MKWISVKDGLPQVDGNYVVKLNRTNFITTFDKGIGFGIMNENLCWLDESTEGEDAPSEQDAVECLIKLEGGKQCEKPCDICIKRRKHDISENTVDINGLIRSFHAIIERKGANTNWEAIKKIVERVLLYQHIEQYPNFYDFSKPIYPRKPSEQDEDAIWDEFFSLMADNTQLLSNGGIRLKTTLIKQSFTITRKP